MLKTSRASWRIHGVSCICSTHTHTHTVAVCLYSMYCRCDVFSTPAGLSRLCSLLHVSSSVESVLLYCLTAQSIEKSIAFFLVAAVAAVTAVRLKRNGGALQRGKEWRKCLSYCNWFYFILGVNRNAFASLKQKMLRRVCFSQEPGYWKIVRETQKVGQFKSSLLFTRVHWTVYCLISQKLFKARFSFTSPVAGIWCWQ